MHNPLRSEADMFRVVVGVGIALLPVIAVGLLAGPQWGAILLGVEVGIAIGPCGGSPAAPSRTRRRSPPTTTPSTGCWWSPTRRSPAARC